MKVKPRFDRWRSSESTRLPPMWPTFKSQCQSHNYVGSVCWFSPLLREIFLQVPPFSPFLKNQHFQIAIRSGIIQTKNHWVDLLPLNPNRKSFINYVRSSYKNQRKTIVNSWVRCVENNQLVITSGFPTVNFRK